jgi:hypothetical protein
VYPSRRTAPYSHSRCVCALGRAGRLWLRPGLCLLALFSLFLVRQELHDIAKQMNLGVDNFESFVEVLNQSNFLLVRTAAHDPLDAVSPCSPPTCCAQAKGGRKYQVQSSHC